MPTAAERFYQRSHEQNKQRDRSAPLSVADMTALMLSPSHRYASVMRFLSSNPGLDVAELGFGSPVSASALAQFCRRYHVLDVVDRREGFAMPSNLDFTQGDLNDDFPLLDSSFDVVVAMMVVEHLFDPFHSFAEIFRITRPGGTIFINVPNIGSFRCRLQLLRGQMPITSSNDWFEKREWDGNHLHYFTVAETLRLATFTGMTFEAMHAVGKGQKLKRLRPSLLCHEISYVFRKPK